MRDAGFRASRRLTRFGFEDKPLRRTRIPTASRDAGGTLLRLPDGDATARPCATFARKAAKFPHRFMQP
jgi:hypothetical protein